MKFNEDFVPSTVLEAIDCLYSDITDADRESMLKNSPASVHHFMGQYLRNNWSFWEDDTPFKRDMVNTYGLWGHGDDCSGLVLDGLWAKVKGLNVTETLQKTADSYRTHWKKMGLHPESGTEI